MINRFLANTLSAINAVVAIAIIGAAAIAGGEYARDAGRDFGFGVFVGLIAGLLLATMVCGLLALLLDIRAELRELVILARRNPLSPNQPHP